MNKFMPLLSSLSFTQIISSIFNINSEIQKLIDNLILQLKNFTYLNQLIGSGISKLLTTVYCFVIFFRLYFEKISILLQFSSYEFYIQFLYFKL